MKTESLSEYQRIKAIMEKPEEQIKETPGGVTLARQHLMKACNLYNLCVAAVDKAIAPGAPPIVQTSEFFQAAVASLFIEASRSGFVEKMPDKALK